MKKLLGILVLGLLWCSNVYAAKGDGVCGLQSQLSDMTDASISIKLAALVKVIDTDKENCKKIKFVRFHLFANIDNPSQFKTPSSS